MTMRSRALLFYVADLALGVVSWTVLFAGWLTTLLLAITPLVVPLLIGLRVAVGGLAQAQAYVARELLGASAHPSWSSRGTGFWSRGLAVLRHGSFWKQQASLALAWPVALVPLALFAGGLELATLPIWYRWVDSTKVIGLFDVHTFGESLPFAAVGLVLLAVVAYLLGPMGSMSRRLADALLVGDAGADGVPMSRTELRAVQRRALAVDAAVSAGIVVLLVVVWALTGGGTFWPIWPLLTITLLVALPGWVVLVLDRHGVARFTLGSEALAMQLGISALLLLFFVGVWAAAGGGYFWPMWPALAFALLAAVHAAIVFAGRERRIERLEETRAGAVDVQEAELRRIERDLHDGAQARLVALGMSLGMAEQAMRTDPDAAEELLAEARRGAREALEELRVLARGIRPPILTDRGLGPAVAALIARTPLPVTLSVDAAGRYPSAVETAAYFTVAEALTNAIKHANATHVDIDIEASGDMLVVEVVDDGDGGANPSGSGLTGLRQRAEALDGRLRVESPVGGPTRVRAELPCASS